MIRNSRSAILMSTCLITLFSGCGQLSLNTVPTETVIRDWMGRFLIEPQEIRGEYQNLDVDCLLFAYHSEAKSADDFWKTLDLQVKAENWEKTDIDGPNSEYRRYFAKGETHADRPDMTAFESFEVTRVFLHEATMTAVIGMVQADASSGPKNFEETGEGKWSRSAFWPRFEKLVSKISELSN